MLHGSSLLPHDLFTAQVFKAPRHAKKDKKKKKNFLKTKLILLQMGLN